MITATSSRSLLTALGVEHPEWRSLLAVVDEALREAERPEWTSFVPALAHSGLAGRPLLDGAVINVAPRLVRLWVRQILKMATAAWSETEPLAAAVTLGSIDPLLLFETALSQDVHRLDELARLARDGRDVVLRGLAPLIAAPMLQACCRTWADRVPADWAHGYCPICGGWPALAEIRGLDGSRHLRCGWCGSDWRIGWLRCPFCGEDDHEKLGSLVPPDRLERRTIEVCGGCRGYVKTITTLTPIEPDHVVLQDLATVVLDVAALERDYRRPTAKGREVTVAVVAEPWRLSALLGLHT